MITDADIEKLKAVFATKEDLMGMEQRLDKKFATKDEMISMEQRLKSELRKEIVGDIVDYLHGNILPVLNEHEKRLDRLEKRVGGFPSLT